MLSGTTTVQSDNSDDEEWQPPAQEDADGDLPVATDGQLTYDELREKSFLACDNDGNPLGPHSPHKGEYKLDESVDYGCDFLTHGDDFKSDLGMYESFLDCPYTTLVKRVGGASDLCRCATVYKDKTGKHYYYLWDARHEMKTVKGLVGASATHAQITAAGDRTGNGLDGLPAPASKKIREVQRPQFKKWPISSFAHAYFLAKSKGKDKTTGKVVAKNSKAVNCKGTGRIAAVKSGASQQTARKVAKAKPETIMSAVASTKEVDKVEPAKRKSTERDTNKGLVTTEERELPPAKKIKTTESWEFSLKMQGSDLPERLASDIAALWMAGKVVSVSYHSIYKAQEAK